MERETILIVDDNPVTAYAMKGDEERILAAGCDGYIPNLTEFYQGMPAPAATSRHRAKNSERGTCDDLEYSSH